MDHRKAADADDVFELLHRLFVTRGVADIVAGGENVACVDADPHPFGVLDAVDDRLQLFEAVPDAGTLPGSSLEDAHDPGPGRLRMNQVQRFDDPGDTVPFPGSHVRSGMEIEKLYANRRAAPDFVGERLPGF